MVTIQFTQEQQRDLDLVRSKPAQIVDPRTNVEYVLIPAAEYEAVREIIEDEQRRSAIRSVALRNVIGRMNEDPLV